MEKIYTNWLFLVIIGITVVLQIIIVELAGSWAGTAGLTVDQWFSCLFLAFITIPVGFVIRLIPVPKMPSERKPNPNEDIAAVEITSGSVEEMDLP